MASQRLTSTTRVVVRVQDENDNDPVFAQKNHRAAILESHDSHDEELYRFKPPSSSFFTLPLLPFQSHYSLPLTHQRVVTIPE